MTEASVKKSKNDYRSLDCCGLGFCNWSGSYFISKIESREGKFGRRD